MPYIIQEDRYAIDLYISHILDLNLNEGQLNYVITKLLNSYIGKNGLSYSNLNSLIGVLECAKMELYRRILSPYEDIKINQNGDVYFINENNTNGN